MYHKYVLLFALVLLHHLSYGQRAVLSGRVTGSGLPVEAATVALLQAHDSSLVKVELTDDKGRFSIAGVLAGEYLLSVSFVGFRAGIKKILVPEEANDEVAIDLQKQDSTLGEVAITARRPLIEMSTGKMVVNVEGSAIVSNNALDLLRRLPGITVTQDDNITMNGKQGLLVLINDRPTYLSGRELADYLRSMTADEIAQLELITQPGAKYDATGNTGIINFKTKRNKKAGFNGSVGLLLGQGVYSNGNASTQLSYRNRKLSLQLTANDHEATGFGDWRETQHTYNTDGTEASTNEIHSHAKERFGVGSAQLMADYSCTERTTVGTSVRGSYHPNTYNGHATALKTNMATGTTVLNDIINPDGFIRKDVATNAYLSHKFSKEHTLDINADYLAYGNYGRQGVMSRYYDGNNNQLPDSLILNSKLPTIIDVISLKADHSIALHNGIKLESGLKSSYVNTDNNAQFITLQNGQWQPDTIRSNHFVYRENIYAAYVSASKDLGTKWHATVGLRGEQTVAQGIQYVHGNSFERNYGSLFPTAYLNYKADSNNQLELNYGKRIDRPPYHQLNPFIRYSFQYSYSVGNPYLLPLYTHNIELKHSYKNKLITTLGYSSTKGMINDMLETDGNGRLYTIFRNGATYSMTSCYMVYNQDLWKWCSVNASAFVAYVKYTGIANNVPAMNEGIPYSLHLNVQATLGKGWTTAMNGYFEDGTVASLIQTYGTQLYTEIGISKKIGSSMQVRLSANDPFYLCKLTVHTNMPGFHADALFRNATQMAIVEFNYSFGKAQRGNVREVRMDERERIR